MKKRVVKLVLTESQRKKVKQIFDIDCEVCELPVENISKEEGGIKNLLDPKKKKMRLNKEQIEILKEFSSKPPKSIIIDRDNLIAMYGVKQETLAEKMPEEFKKYLDDI